jgi:hypothetical protein
VTALTHQPAGTCPSDSSSVASVESCGAAAAAFGRVRQWTVDDELMTAERRTRTLGTVKF